MLKLANQGSETYEKCAKASNGENEQHKGIKNRGISRNLETRRV